jgi:hypothetical protein
MTSLRYRLLVHLADEGTVEDPAGKVTSVLAEALAAPTAQVGEVLTKLHRDGLVWRDLNRVSRRTFRVRLTEAGRAEVGRDGHTNAAVPRRVAPPAQRAPMPQPGPMVTVPFDVENARERALGGVA